MRSVQRLGAAVSLRGLLAPPACGLNLLPVAIAALPAAAFHTSAICAHNRPDWPVQSAQLFRDRAAEAQAAAKAAEQHARGNVLPAVRVEHPHPLSIDGADAQAAEVARGISELGMDASAASAPDVDPTFADLRALLTTPASHFAVVRHRGTQFKVVEDDLVMLDRVSGPNSAIGSELRLRDVLLLGGRDATLIGRPRVEGAEVWATIEEHTHTAKIIVFKKKRRKGFKRKQGHRDMVTVVRINKILLPPDAESLTRGAVIEHASVYDAAAETAANAAAEAAPIRTNLFKADRAARRAARDVSAQASSSASTAQSVHAAAAGQRAFSTLGRRAPFSGIASRLFSSAAAADAPARTNEASIERLLRDELKATALHIEDTSGGCGAFFKVMVVSPAFTGLSLVKQHRLVNQTLKPHIANLHGLTLTTLTQEQFQAQQKK